MRGCDNFCTYCIVPYVRGREAYREPDEVLAEVNELVGAGYKDITLIGQNVNSYKHDDYSFARLLREVNSRCNGVFLRFTTNHPRDFDDEVIAAVSECENVARNVHLPLQAGSDLVLEKMNRGYNREQFIQLAENLRAAKPGLCLTSDIMVGFPGESEEDFEATLNVVRRVRFDGAYTFIYSPRPGTEAAKWQDDVPREEKKRRINELIALQRDISREQNARFLGQTTEVLAEGPSKKDEAELAGHNSENKVVNFAGSADIGEIVSVKVTEASSWTLRGEMVK
jgi:tRNA-2-methylthio-N6-dimethylallyladenosine synthase